MAHALDDGMSDLMMASVEDKLWHKMRGDLARYAPEIAGNRLLMCCACGRRLPREAFDLEHLIPQQALKQDPDVVRVNPFTPANVRAGNLLLCKKPLILKGTRVCGNGCNGWKGRFYDKPISELVSGSALEAGGRLTDRHIIAALALGYLAMVAAFGYAVALMRSGLLMREQFFSPNKFHRSLSLRHQMVLGGPAPTLPDARMWTSPFSFSFENRACTVGARNFAILLPVSRDPREPLARHLRFAPSKFKLRPDFTTVFD
jgi:hypothetical protein